MVADRQTLVYQARPDIKLCEPPTATYPDILEMFRYDTQIYQLVSPGLSTVSIITQVYAACLQTYKVSVKTSDGCAVGDSNCPHA